MTTELRDTRQRRAIRAIFERAERPLGVEDVHRAALAAVPGIGVATVYRTIAALVENGLLSTVEIAGEPARYERAGQAHHHHFHCDRCGRVFDLEGCVANIRALLPSRFRLRTHEVTLSGLCSACAEPDSSVAKARSPRPRSKVRSRRA